MINMRIFSGAILLLAALTIALPAFASYGSNTFEFVGGVQTKKFKVPTGSWFGIQHGSSKTYYTAINSILGTDVPGPNAILYLDKINTITLGPGGGCPTCRNSGNMIDRDWKLKGKWGAHFTTAPLPVSGTGNTLKIDMTGWAMAWDGTARALGGGFGKIKSNDGIWGNGNDTLDYSVMLRKKWADDDEASDDKNEHHGKHAKHDEDDDRSSRHSSRSKRFEFDDDEHEGHKMRYTLHLQGSFHPVTAVPLPPALLLMISGLAGLVGTAKWRKGRV